MFGTLRLRLAPVSGQDRGGPPAHLHLWSAAADLDLGFARRLFLTLAHIIPSLVFVVLGPRNPALHRRTGHVFLADGS